MIVFIFLMEPFVNININARHNNTYYVAQKVIPSDKWDFKTYLSSSIADQVILIMISHALSYVFLKAPCSINFYQQPPTTKIIYQPFKGGQFFLHIILIFTTNIFIFLREKLQISPISLVTLFRTSFHIGA